MPRSRSRIELSDEALGLVAGRFRALADPSRLRVLCALMGGERPVGAVVAETGLHQTSVSKHLAILRREGLVERRPQGSFVHYRIADPGVIRLCEIVCEGIGERLADDLDALPDAATWRGAGI